MAVDKFQLTIEAMTRGEQDIARLEAAINKLSVETTRSAKEFGEAEKKGAHFGAQITDSTKRAVITLGEFAAGAYALKSGFDRLTFGVREHLGHTEKLVNTYRGVRLALSPTMPTLYAVALGAAAEASIKLAYAESKRSEQMAVGAAQWRVAISDYQRQFFVSDRTGIPFPKLMGASQAAGGVDSLITEINAIAATTEPLERAQRAIKLFGADTDEILPKLSRQVGYASAAYKTFVEGVDRGDLQRFKNDITALNDAWHGMGSAISAVGQNAKNAIVDVVTFMNEARKAGNPFNAPQSRLEAQSGLFERMAAPLLQLGYVAQMHSGAPGTASAAAQRIWALEGVNIDKDARAALPGFLGAAQPRFPGYIQSGTVPGAENILYGTRGKSLEDLRTMLGREESSLSESIGRFKQAQDNYEVELLDMLAQAVVQSKRRVEKLRLSVKAAEDAERAAEKLRQYNADVLQYGLMRPSVPSTALLDAVRQGATAYRGPSLLRPGESENRSVIGLDPAVVEATNQRNLEAQRASVEYQIRKLELLAGPGGEIAAVRQSTAIRLAALEEEQRLGLSIFDSEKQRIQILRDGELRLLEIQRSREQERRQAGAAIFDALTAGGGGLSRYAAGFGLGIGRTIFSNTFSQVTGGLAGKLSLTNNPSSMLGKILQGTPFGADPAAQAGAVQLTAGQIQLQAAGKMLTAAAIMGNGGVGTTSGTFAALQSLIPGYIGGDLPMPGDKIQGRIIDPDSGLVIQQLSSRWGKPLMGIGAGVGAGFGVYSGVKQGGAKGALTAIGSAAGGAAALLPMLSSTLALAGPIGGAIAIGATLAMAFLPDPKEARRRALEEQAKQRMYEETAGTEYASDLYGRKVDYGKRGDTRVYIYAMDSKSFGEYINENQESVGETVRRALSSYPPLTMDIKGAALGA